MPPEKIIGKHAIKLKIDATPIDLKQENSKRINQTRINSYPNSVQVHRVFPKDWTPWATASHK